MNFIYCQSCFKKTGQTSDIVKFCSHCGKPFISVSSSSRSVPPKTQPQENIVSFSAAKSQEADDWDDDEEGLDGEDVTNVPNLRGLKVEIDIPESKPVTIRSVARNAKRNYNPKDGKKRTKKDKEKFLKEFQKSASAIRKS